MSSLDEIGEELQRILAQIEDIMAFKGCSHWVLAEGHTIVVNGKQYNLKAYPSIGGNITWAVYVKEMDTVFWGPE